MTHTRATLVWYMIALMALLTVASFALTGLSVDPLSNPATFALIVVLFAISWFYRSVRPNANLKVASEAAGQLLLILLFGILLTYAAASTHIPYRDAAFARIDLALGFDRRAYLDFFASRPWLGTTVSLAYSTLLPQLLLVPLALFVTDRVPRLHTWMVAISIALIATAGISTFAPALTAYVYSDVHLHVPPGVYTLMPTMEDLRAGTFHTVRLNHLEGLVSFPSFHTVEALLFVWVLWPLRYLRWAALAVNTALIAATPIDGAHYAIDVAGGVPVAIAAVLASHWLCRRVSPAPEVGADEAMATGTAVIDGGRA